MLKKVDTNLLSYLTERGAHDFTTEKAAIEYFTGDPDSTKEELMKCFHVIRQVLETFLYKTNVFSRIDRNKTRNKGPYNWSAIKEKVQDHLNTCYVYENASHYDKIDEATLRQMDFIMAENPSVGYYFCHTFLYFFTESIFGNACKMF
jgi:hypothetical protein